MKYEYKISDLLVEIDFLKKKIDFYKVENMHDKAVLHAIEKQILKIEDQIIRIGNRL